MANLQIRVDDVVRDRAREVAAGMEMDFGESRSDFSESDDSRKRIAFPSDGG